MRASPKGDHPDRSGSRPEARTRIRPGPGGWALPSEVRASNRRRYSGSGPLEIQYPPHTDSLPRIARAIDAAASAGIPVVAVQYTMGGRTPVQPHPARLPAAPGLAAEVLSDATGALNIANEAGFADAETVHTTLMALFNSNFAAVADTATWSGAVAAKQALPKPDLGSPAVTGARRAGQA